MLWGESLSSLCSVSASGAQGRCCSHRPRDHLLLLLLLGHAVFSARSLNRDHHVLRIGSNSKLWELMSNSWLQWHDKALCSDYKYCRCCCSFKTVPWSDLIVFLNSYIFNHVFFASILELKNSISFNSMLKNNVQRVLLWYHCFSQASNTVGREYFHRVNANYKSKRLYIIMNTAQWQDSIPCVCVDEGGSWFSPITFLLLWRTCMSSTSATFRPVPLREGKRRWDWSFMLSWCAKQFKRLNTAA